MKKFILRGLAALTLLLSGASMTMAQEMQQLPQDPALVTGKLDNGLTYYIRKNATPKGQADFYIAQKVGSILEEDNQRGLAHFLEHMCFNGTTNFPEKGIINWLESVGVKFGYNLNAYTSVDETVYNISNVPVSRTSVQDSCLLILHDWSCDLTLDPKEIDAERGVIHEEWRRSNVGSMRVLEQLLPTIYPDNRYGYRLPIGTMEVVDNFPAQALVDYYHTWYRPDQQAIIVVGDIDPTYIESKIKEIFSPIPMPANAKERIYFEVEDTPGTIYAIGKDKEVKAGEVMMMFKTETMVPREMRNTQLFFAVNYMTTMVQRMLNNRLSELAKKPDTDYASASVYISDFFLAKTKEALTLNVTGKGNDILPGFAEAYREVLRATQHGFTVGEYERARAEFISSIEKEFDSRDDRENDSYSKEYVRLFVDNIPAPGIAVEKQLYDQYANVFTVDQINTLLPQLVTDDNRIVVAILPENDTYVVPTEEQFVATVNAIDDETLEAYKDEMRTDPLIPNLPKAGKITSSRKLAEWNATEYTLSNGVKVIVKPTEFAKNEIYFDAIAVGNGTSTVDPALAATVKFMPYALSRHGLNDYTNSDLQKYLQGKQANVGFTADSYLREVEGNTTIKDLPTLMELIYATFTGMNITADEFAAMQSSIKGIVANQESNPEYLFGKNLMKALFKAPAKQAITSADIEAAKLDETLAITRKMLANAADYTFVFTGNIDEATFLPLMEQYIATLPADAAKASKTIVTDPAFEPAPGNDTVVNTTEMQTPQSWVFIATFGKTDYTAKNKLLASIAGQILSKRLLNKIREEMGATYSIGASSSLSRYGETNTVLQIPFPMKPEMKDEALAAIKDMVFAMTSDVTAEELNPVKEFMVKSANESLEKNEDWAGAIAATQINGVQTFTNAVETLNEITVEDVQNFMKQLLDQGNYRVILLDPEKKD